MSTRGLLYQLARILGDITAVKKGKVGKRIKNKIIGRTILKKLFK